MTTEKRRELRNRGRTLTKAIDDMIAERGVSQIDLADATGKSKTLVSFICNPSHPAQWTLRDLPALLEMLDGPAFLRIICGWYASVPFELPADSEAKVAAVLKATANLQMLIADVLADGRITDDEAAAVKRRLLDLAAGAL